MPCRPQTHMGAVPPPPLVPHASADRPCAGVQDTGDKDEKRERRRVEVAEREARKAEAQRAKEADRVRTARQREAKRQEAAAEKEKRAEERKRQAEDRRRCVSCPACAVPAPQLDSRAPALAGRDMLAIQPAHAWNSYNHSWHC